MASVISNGNQTYINPIQLKKIYNNKSKTYKMHVLPFSILFSFTQKMNYFSHI